MPADCGELPESMKIKCFVPLCWLIIAISPVFGQEKLYPVRPPRGISVLLTSDRSAVVVDKAFQHKLTLGFPDDDTISIFPETRTPFIALWLRIQNVSQRPMAIDTTKFSSTDDQGKAYAMLMPDEALQRMIAGASGASLGAKTLHGISLGRAGNKRTEEDVREDIVRYSLRSVQIPPGGVKEGLIYFEGPQRKKFTLSVVLGDLWSKPLVFSTEKQK